MLIPQELQLSLSYLLLNLLEGGYSAVLCTTILIWLSLRAIAFRLLRPTTVEHNNLPYKTA